MEHQESAKVASRNRQILEAAIALASERGFRQFSRRDVADRAKVADGSVNNAYGTMDGLHEAVMAAAVERKLLTIIAGGLVMGHPGARAAPQDLKDSALANLAA
jgi:AcrR family transcriptional regulator